MRRRPELVLSVGVFIVCLAVFWRCAAPGATLHDSGEFALAAARLGIPHPPGAPTWTLLAGLWVRLAPAVDPARMTNLFSGLCGALAAALLSSLGYAWARRLFGRHVSLWGALAGPLVFLQSYWVMEQATTTEQYTLLVALQAALMRLATPALWGMRVSAGQATAMGALVGLAVGNHPSQFVLLAPLALALGSADLPRRARSVRLGQALGAMTLALGVFFYLPIRSRANPVLDWGDIETWDRFLWAVGRGQWQRRPLAEAPEGFVAEWWQSYDPLGQWGILGCALALVGVAIFFTRARRVGLFWVSCFVPYSAGMLLAHLGQAGIDLNYLRQYGVGDWHLPLYFCGALAAAIGASGLAAVGILPLGRRGVTGFALAGLGVLAVTAALLIRSSSLRTWRFPERYVQALLTDVPSGALMALTADNPANRLVYEYGMGRIPGDRRVCYGVIWPTPLLGKYLAQGAAWTTETKRALVARVMEPRDQPVRFSDPERLAERPLVCQYKGGETLAAGWMRPAGLLFEIADRPVSSGEARQAEEMLHRRHPALFAPGSPRAHRLEREAWLTLHAQRGDYFLDREMWTEAEASYRLAATWVERNASVWFHLGWALESQGKVGEAATAYQFALDSDPGLAGPRVSLAVLHAQAGRLGEAEILLQEELRRHPESAAARGNLQIVQRQRQDERGGA